MVIKRLYSYATLSAIAALAFVVACVAHEVVGHGGMCLALGGHITMLTSVYSHCSNGGVLTSAAGPLMGLMVGMMFWAILWRALPSLSLQWRLFMVFVMALNLFWGVGYFVSSAVTNTGDWAFVLRDLALQPNWLWRCLMGVLGVYLYYRSIRLVALYLPSRTPLVAPYLVVGLIACFAVLFFKGPVLPALGEATQEGFGVGVGLLPLAYLNSSRVGSASSIEAVDQHPGWILTAVLVTVLFFATMGRGFISGSHA